MTKRILLFPVETFSRELDYRVTLAAALAQENYQIFVGKHSALMDILPAMRGACYIGKQVIRPHFPSDRSNLDVLDRHGVRFVHYDTEGAVYGGDQMDWGRILDSRLDPSILSENGAIFTWGAFQAAHYSSTSHVPVDAVGYPAFDLLRSCYQDYYAEESQVLRTKFGSFILINTNFARANHGHGLKTVFSESGGYFPGDTVRTTKVLERWAYQQRMIAEFVELIDAIALNTTHHIIIRPHPSEDLSFYETVFAGRKSISVVRDGPVGPWLKAARLLIQNGCTTAVEAAFAGVPVISYKTGLDTPMLPAALSSHVDSVDACIEAIKDVSLVRPPVTPDLAADLIANFYSDSFELFRLAIQRLELEPGVCDRAMAERLFRRYEVKEAIKWPVRQVSPTHRAANRYALSKFPGFETTAIRSRFQRANAILGATANHRVWGPELLEVW